MKKLIFFLTLIYCTCACNSDKLESAKTKTCTVTGTVKALQSGEVYIQVYNRTQEKPNTIKIVNGKFSYSSKASNHELAIMIVADAKKNVDRKNVMMFFVEPDSKININIDTATKEKYVVTGSKANDEFISFKKNSLAAIEEKEKQTFENVNPMSINNPATMDSLMKLAEIIQQERKKVVLDYISKNKSSYVGIGYAFLLSIQNDDAKFIETAYTSASDTLKNSYYGTEFKKKIDASSKTEIGAVAADFTSTEIDGKGFKLSDFYKGKVLVLIDFWASWCGPCRKENPNVVKAYNQFHSKGFDIVGVSLDEEKHDWIGAVKKDKLTWNQVSDLKGWESQVARLYNVTAIPTNFLIDGNGKILASNLRGNDLENKLQELLK